MTGYVHMVFLRVDLKAVDGSGRPENKKAMGPNLSSQVAITKSGN